MINGITRIMLNLIVNVESIATTINGFQRVRMTDLKEMRCHLMVDLILDKRDFLHPTIDILKMKQLLPSHQKMATLRWQHHRPKQYLSLSVQCLNMPKTSPAMKVVVIIMKTIPILEITIPIYDSKSLPQNVYQGVMSTRYLPKS